MGVVRKNNETTAVFRVNSIEELQVVINHFDNYPLISAKHSDYLLFKQCYHLIKQKEHLTQTGFEKILALKYNLNKGLPIDLKNAFPHITPVARPEYKVDTIPSPYWVSGFVSGDSTFGVYIEKSTTKTGKRVRLVFGTCLHLRDKNLLVLIGNYLNNLDLPSFALWRKNSDIPSKNVSIYCSESKDTALLQIKNIFDVENKIIPFFNKYPILGIKALDFEDFKKVAEMVRNKEHLNNEGLTKIIQITEGMNLDRKLESSIKE